MKLNKNKRLLIGGGIVIIIVGIVMWWLWWSAVPYDVNDPEVQAKLSVIEELRQAIKDDKNIVNSYIEIGHIYGQLGDDRRELSAYKALAKIRPKSSPPFIAMGQFYRERKMIVLAEENLLKAAINDPDNVPIYQDLSFLYIYYDGFRNENNFEPMILDAINDYQNLEANFSQILAFYFKETGNSQKAIQYFNRLIELAPERANDWQTEIADLNK